MYYPALRQNDIAFITLGGFMDIRDTVSIIMQEAEKKYGGQIMGLKRIAQNSFIVMLHQIPHDSKGYMTANCETHDNKLSFFWEAFGLTYAHMLVKYDSFLNYEEKK